MGFIKPYKYVSDYPELMEDWDWERNNKLGLDPTKITFGAADRPWWKCKEGHIYRTAVCTRTRGHGCPYCSHKRVMPGVRDLLTLHPEIAKQWHPTLNYLPIPIGVSPNSYEDVFWQCEHGHIWVSSPYWRTHHYENSNCPYCSGKREWSNDALMYDIQHHGRQNFYWFLYDIQPYVEEYYNQQRKKNNYNISKWIANVDYDPNFFKKLDNLYVPEGKYVYTVSGDPQSIIFEYTNVELFNEFVARLCNTYGCFDYCYIERIDNEVIYLKIKSRKARR